MVRFTVGMRFTTQRMRCDARMRGCDLERMVRLFYNSTEEIYLLLYSQLTEPNPIKLLSKSNCTTRLLSTVISKQVNQGFAKMSRLSAYSRWKVTGPFAAAAYIIATVAGRLPVQWLRLFAIA